MIFQSNGITNAIGVMSAAGTAVSLFLLIIKPVIKDRIKKSVHYYLWIFALSVSVAAANNGSRISTDQFAVSSADDGINGDSRNTESIRTDLNSESDKFEIPHRFPNNNETGESTPNTNLIPNKPLISEIPVIIESFSYIFIPREIENNAPFFTNPFSNSSNSTPIAESKLEEPAGE